MNNEAHHVEDEIPTATDVLEEKERVSSGKKDKVGKLLKKIQQEINKLYTV